MMVNPFLEVIHRILPEPQSSLLSGILFGVKSSFSADLYEALIVTGTIHIVVLSGQNISILSKVLAETTLPLGRKKSLLVTVAGLLIYVILIGFEPTLVRAFLMGSMSLIAVYFGRLNWSLLSLFLAAGIMLLLKPEWVGDLSFQLSFLATLGIILFGPSGRPKAKNVLQELKNAVRMNLQTTLAAQLATIPLILVHFERFSLIAPFTNVLVGWTIMPTMILGFLMVFGGWLFLPLGQLIGLAVWVPLTYVIWIIQATAAIPWASLSF